MGDEFWKNTKIYPMNPRGMTASQVGYIRDIIWDVMNKHVTIDYLKVVPENEVSSRRNRLSPARN